MSGQDQQCRQHKPILLQATRQRYITYRTLSPSTKENVKANEPTSSKPKERLFRYALKNFAAVLSEGESPISLSTLFFLLQKNSPYHNTKLEG